MTTKPDLDAPIPFALSAIDRPIPYRPRCARMLGSLEHLIAPAGAIPCVAPPAEESGPRLKEAV
jgi:hypothetical protein